MNGDKKIVIILVVIFEIFLFGIAIAGIALELDSAVIVIAVLLLAVLSVFMAVTIKNSACPKCGKKLSMMEISRKITDSRATTIDVERKVRNNKGDVIKTYYEAVPATRYFYDCVDECKNCGFRRDVKREEVIRD